MGRLCERMLMDHEENGDARCADDPEHSKALEARRLARANMWSPIVRGGDAGGRRDFLDGRPIHCGDSLELQAIDVRDDDFGSFTVWTSKGVRVRYELEPDKRITLYAGVAGLSFTHPHEQGMRFRWPKAVR